MLKPFLFFCFVSCFVFLQSCEEDFSRNTSHAQTSLSSIRKGKELAAKYCQSCHLLPDPSLLDSKTWEKGVLPNMGPLLGIFAYGFEKYPSSKNDINIAADFYPSQPLLNTVEWQNIIDYYTAVSPDTLPGQQRKYPIREDQTLFAAEFPATVYTNSATSFLKINALDPLHPLIVSDAVTKSTFIYNQELKVVDSAASGAIVNMDLNQTSIIASDIGVLHPNNGRFGKAQFMSFDQRGKLNTGPKPLFDSLQRPVQVTPADLNKDGKMDYIICEFGFLTGSFSWMENVGEYNFKRHVLRAFPGAIKAYVQDYNQDGLPDIWVLFGQGEEGIFLYTNKGKGEFSQEAVLRFSPANGSSYFELTDFNKDGYQDIVYTCGDNADFSPVLKPFHGVYIYLNDKTNHFREKYFYPINGCYKAIARDYDNDGDIDIAAISYFADYKNQPEEGFVYLKNKGNLDFMPYTIPEATIGRWLTMDAGDINGDGKIDLVLGNFSLGPALNRSAVDWTKAPQFIVLKNIIK